MASKPPQSENGNRLGWFLAAFFGLALIVWLSSSKDLGTTTSAVNATATEALATTEQPEQPSIPLALDVTAARRGYAQFLKLAAASVPGSSEIFSRNCYEALSKPFDWHQLDRCGAFDALAARWVGENEGTAGEDDLSFFQSETAATRYLQAATRAGLPAQAADERWASIQSMASRTRLPQRALPPELTGAIDDATLADPNASAVAPGDEPDESNATAPS